MTFFEVSPSEAQKCWVRKAPIPSSQSVFSQKREKIQGRVGKDSKEASCFGMKNGEGFSNSMQREGDLRHPLQAMEMGCRANPEGGHYICKTSELK